MAERATLVGRRDETALLRHWLGEAKGGAGRLVLISAAAGMGKTWLVEDLAATTGIRVGWGAALDDPGMPPLWPWLRALRPFHGPSDAVQAALQLGTDDLSAAEASVVEFAAHTSTIDAIEEHARQVGGVLLVLEDLHWADEPSLRLLDRLAAAARRLPVLVVATLRPSATVELSAALPGLLARPGTEILHLGGMSVDQAAELVAQVVSDADPRAVRGITEQVGGNPLYLRTIARVAPDLLRQPSSTMQVVARVPELRDLIAHALSGLGAGAELMQALTVVGDEADLRLLAELTSVADPHQALGPVATSGLVDLSGERVRVTHALIRDAVYTSMHPHHRVELHRRAARALEARSPDDPSLAGEIARHWWCTDTPAAALPWAVRAADMAAGAGAHALAAAHLRRTLEFLDANAGGRASAAGHPDVVTLLLDLARNNYLAGDLTASLEACERVAQEATRRADWETAARAALVIQGVNDPRLMDALTRLASTALRHLEDSEGDHVALQARLEAQLVRATQDGDEMTAWATLAMEHAIRSGDADSELDALVAQWPLLHAPGQAERRLEAGRRVIALAQVTQRPLATLWGHTWRVDGAMELGDVGSARAETAEIDALAQRLPLPIIRWHALRVQAAWALLRGDFARAEECSYATVEVSRQLNDLSGLGIHAAFLLAVANLRGGADPLPAELVELLDWAPALPVVLASRAMALWCAGRRDEAAAAITALPLRSIDLRVPTSLAMALYAAELAIHLNDVEACQVMADLFGSIHATSPTIGAGSVLWYGSTARTLGRLILASGSTDQAIPMLEQGIAVDESIGARPYVALGRWALATGLCRRGDHADLRRAAELARLALSEAAGLGMIGLHQDASALLDDIAHRSSILSPFTARENEIVALVIEAKSNRAIAEQLYLSERTVEGHVRNILAETGATSRSELIRHLLGSDLRTGT